MGFVSFLKNSILRADLFAAPPIFRYKGEPAYETFFGGCLSILLIIGFASIFATSFLNILNKVNVEAIVEIENSPFHEAIINDMWFSVGIEGIDFRDNLKYFTLKLEQL